MAQGPVAVPQAHFSSIPTSTKWAADAKELSKRQTDRLLVRIGDLLSAIENKRSEGEGTYYLCELFYSTKYWIRNVAPTLPREQQAPVHALHTCVLRALGRVLDCPKVLLPATLQKHYCCAETAHGIYCDSHDVVRKFTMRGDGERFKLYFEGGVAYWVPWWSKTSGTKMEPVNTRIAYDKSSRKPLIEGAAFFVMNRYRNMYASPHLTDPKQTEFPMYHSTIPSEQAVQFAGSIKIDGGKVTALGSDSGHYKPEYEYFLNVLEHLKGLGVALQDIEVSAIDEGAWVLKGNGEKVLAELRSYKGASNPWEAIKNRAEMREDVWKESGKALRGLSLVDRIRAVQGPLRERTLAKFIAEEYQRVRRQYPNGHPGAQWDDVRERVFAPVKVYFAMPSGPKDEDLAKWFEDMEESYKNRPPLPESKPPVTPKPGSKV